MILNQYDDLKQCLNLTCANDNLVKHEQYVEAKLETFNIKLLIIQKVKQHNIKVYNFIIINNTSYKIKF